jgi:hypothetical protein
MAIKLFDCKNLFEEDGFSKLIDKSVKSGLCYINPNSYILNTECDDENNNEYINMVISKQDFKSRYDKYTNGNLDFINDWSNVIFAGGGVLNIIDKFFDIDSHLDHDIDLFLYGSVEIQKEKFLKLISSLSELYPDLKFYVKNFGKQVIDIHLGENKRKIQVIFTNFMSPDEIIESFDYDCCKIYYNGNDVYISPNGTEYSLKNRVLCWREYMPGVEIDHERYNSELKLMNKISRCHKYMSVKGFRFRVFSYHIRYRKWLDLIKEKTVDLKDYQFPNLHLQIDKDKITDYVMNNDLNLSDESYYETPSKLDGYLLDYCVKDYNDEIIFKMIHFANSSISSEISVTLYNICIENFHIIKDKCKFMDLMLKCYSKLRYSLGCVVIKYLEDYFANYDESNIDYVTELIYHINSRYGLIMSVKVSKICIENFNRFIDKKRAMSIIMNTFRHLDPQLKERTIEHIENLENEDSYVQQVMTSSFRDICDYYEDGKYYHKMKKLLSYIDMDRIHKYQRHLDRYTIICIYNLISKYKNNVDVLQKLFELQELDKESDHSCGICLQNDINLLNFKCHVNSKYFDHLYCFDCFEDWFQKNQYYKCCLCQSSINFGKVVVYTQKN